MVSKPSFKEAYMNTYIGELPSIINKNFEEASTAINTIVEYDASTDPYVKLPVNTSGNVKALCGFFRNLIVEDNLTINGNISIDISNIKYDDSTSLKEKLDNIDASINELIRQLELGYQNSGYKTNTNNSNILSSSKPLLSNITQGTSVYNAPSSLSQSDINLYICALKSSDSYTYNQKYYLMNSVINDPSIFRCKADYIDVINKNPYRYYNVYNNKYVKIGNELSSCFRCCEIGDVVIPILKEECDKDFIISIGNKNIVIPFSDYQITNLQLICTDVDEDGKCLFDLVNYAGKISIE